MGGLKKIKLTIFRDMPEEGFFSMERYADGLHQQLSAIRYPLSVGQFIMHTPTFSDTLKLFFRLGVYPLVARFYQGEVNHVLDHSYGHLLYHLDRKRTVATCHDLIPLEYEEDPFALRIFKYSVGGLKKAAWVLADSYATKGDLVRYLGISEEKIRVVYLGVDQEKFQITNDKLQMERVRKKYNLPEGRILLHVGNSLAYKNIEGILKAFREVLSNRKTVYLVKVGRLTKSQRGLAAKLGLREKILEREDVPDEDLPLFYNLAHTLVYPSFKEGFGFPLLEALACGCPVVASKGTSLEELGGKAVIYVDPRDSSSITKGILDVFHSSALEYHNRQEKGLNQAKMFTWEKTAKETLKVYQEVCNSITRRGQN